MTVELFAGRDDEYMDWIAKHRGGWVVNANKHPKPSYLQLHKAWCPTISDERRKGAYTERAYVKFCSVDKVELEQELAQKVGARPTWNCTQCG